MGFDILKTHDLGPDLRDVTGAGTCGQKGQEFIGANRLRARRGAANDDDLIEKVGHVPGIQGGRTADQGAYGHHRSFINAA